MKNQNETELLYQKIGSDSLELAVDLSGKLLIYAEIEDGVISGSVFYQMGSSRKVIFKYCSENLRESVYLLWEKWRSDPSNNEWCAIAYLIQDGRFTIDLTYPNSFNPNEGLPDRRPRVINKYFGNTEVDYSTP